MASFGFLEPKEEEELYKSRLLNIEEKPFKRVTKRLSTLHAYAKACARQEQTPPPENANDAEAASKPSPSKPEPAELAHLREDISLDFAAFDSTISRLQFSQSANARERVRYGADRETILATCQTVRDDTTALRTRLEQARATLAQRRKFDELADKITSNQMLRPRADQRVNLRKLEEECAQLEAESEAYAVTWRERRDQFARIMDESNRLRRLIRDEKEEVERREGMDEDDEAGGGGGNDGPDEGQTPRPGVASGHGTPRPDSGLIPKTTAGLDSVDASTPRPGSAYGGRTPARETPGPEGEGLKPPSMGHESASRSGSQAPSREPSPERDAETQQETGEDVDMEEAGRTEGDEPMEDTQETPRITIEGDDAREEKMDTT